MLDGYIPRWKLLDAVSTSNLESFARGLTELGGIYMNRKDFAQGVAWLKKAAKAGFSYAQADLGQAYFFGDGVSENKAEGYKWLFIATENKS